MLHEMHTEKISYSYQEWKVPIYCIAMVVIDASSSAACHWILLVDHQLLPGSLHTCTHIYGEIWRHLYCIGDPRSCHLQHCRYPKNSEHVRGCQILFARLLYNNLHANSMFIPCPTISSIASYSFVYQCNIIY